LVQAGGSATINGILYQVLACLDWATELSINAAADQNDLSQARLIIEPAGGGGDLRVHAGQKRVVEQWKAKSNYGTWSLNQVIEEVIPDLCLAAENNIHKNTEYRFVTEGRKGTWKEAYNFFRSLRSKTFQNDPLDALDAKAVIKFFPSDSQACTEHDLFQMIVLEARKRHAVKAEPELDTRKKVWDVLANFQFNESVKSEDLISRVNGLLLSVVEYREDVNAKRLELCGAILDLASKGEVNITPGELLKAVGLSKESFRNWPAFKNRLALVLKAELQKRTYSDERDIRETPDWPHKIPIFTLAGSSGQGKTWQLAKVAYETDAAGDIAAFINSQGNAEHDLERIADTIWKKGLNRETPHSLDQVVERLRIDVPYVKETWLTVCLDDVQTVAEAKSLVEYQWDSLGWQLPPPWLLVER
jgi:hypothetical protein